MKTIDRYMLREMVVPFLIGQAAIVLMLTGSVLYNNASVLIQNQVPVSIVARMVLYFIPFLIHMTMPVAMAVASSLAVSRLARDSEITVMRAAGIPMLRIFAPVVVVGLLVSLGDLWLGEIVIPRAVDRFDGVLQEIPTKLPSLMPEAGKYIVASDQRYVIYVETIGRAKDFISLRGIRLMASPSALSSPGEALTLAADTGRFQDGTWTFYKPLMYRASADGKKFEQSRADVFQLRFAVDPQAFQAGFLLQLPMWSLAQASRKTLGEMQAQIRREHEQHVDDPFLALDYNYKLSIPFSCLVMALCCPPLSQRFARGGGFMGTLLSICLVFLYWNTLLLTRILGSPGAQGTPPLLAPAIAAWSQNVVFVLVGMWVLHRSE